MIKQLTKAILTAEKKFFKQNISRIAFATKSKIQQRILTDSTIGSLSSTNRQFFHSFVGNFTVKIASKTMVFWPKQVQNPVFQPKSPENTGVPPRFWRQCDFLVPKYIWISWIERFLLLQTPIFLWFYAANTAIFQQK